MSQRAVFLDRDGTLIEHYDYLTDPAQVKLLPNAPRALRRLKDRGFLLVVITNQSAIARGMLTEQKLGDIHARLKSLLAEQGVYLDGIYYCPYHPDAPVARYRRESELRKPAPGMLFAAARELDIDLEQSWIVGDDDRYIQAGRNAGCRTILIDSHSTSPLVQRGAAQADYRAVNLVEAANCIIRYTDRPATSPVIPEPESNEPSPPAEPAESDESQHVPPVDEIVQVEESTSQASESLPTEEEIPEPVDTADLEETAAPDEPKKSTPSERSLRRQEIARRRQRKQPVDPDEVVRPSVADLDSGADTRQLLAQILRELRSRNRHEDFTEFSLARLFAGIVQMLVLLCLVLALYFTTRADPQPDTSHSFLLLGLVFQVLTLTLLVMHRQ